MDAAKQAVCFDVDSTFCEDESIDELAAFLGVGGQVAELTRRAMGGNVKFQDALAARLSLMKCSEADLKKFLAVHPARVTPGIPQLVQKLQTRGTSVFLVSGGFRQIIHPIATSLGIPLANVYANTLLFNEDGSYAGFDDKEYTSRSGGKAAAVQEIRAKYGYDVVVMVGDGATDLEARQPGAANRFIGMPFGQPRHSYVDDNSLRRVTFSYHVTEPGVGEVALAMHVSIAAVPLRYGGVVVRPNIAAQADWYVMDIQPLIDALDI